MNRSLTIRTFTMVALLATALVPAGCRKAGTDGPQSAQGTASDKPQFAYVTNAVASFWSIAAVGAQTAADDLGVNVTVIMPNGLTDQTRKLEDLITRGVDGVAVSPINAENQVDILNKVAKASIMITQDSDAPKSNRLAYVGMDNYDAGLKCGQLVRDVLPDGGTVMLFIGRLDQHNAKLRRQGVIDAILQRTPDAERRDPVGAAVSSDDGKYHVLGTLTDQFDRGKAKANVEDTLTRHPDISAMVGLFVHNPPAILEALERTGKTGKVHVIGFDEDEATLQAIQDGKAVGTVVQDPYQYGYESIRLLVGLYRDGDSALPPNAFIDVPPRVIDNENLGPFWDTLKERMAKN